MKKITDLEITGITCNQRSIQIDWRSYDAGIEAESCLYQHSDGSWAVDPWTRSLGTSFGERLLGAMMKDFVLRSFTYDDSSSFGGSDVDKVEGILKKEDMYKRALRKKRESEDRRQRPVIRVWRAE